MEKLKQKRVIIAGSIVIIVLGLFLFSKHGLITRIQLENQKKEIQQKIKNEKRISDSLKNVIRSLRYDTLEIEREAREKYGMVKPGEEKYFIKSENTEE